MRKIKHLPLTLEDAKRALVLVAHPDDETIWMGGTIMRHANVSWTVVSLCRKSDTDREPKFRRVCTELGVDCLIEDVEDDDIMSLAESVKTFKAVILTIIEGKSFDICFTHNKNGEYGHKRHKGVHFAVEELIEEKNFPIKDVYFFDYKKIDRKILPMIPNDDCTHILELTHKEYENKRKLVAEMYGYPYDGIDVNLCTNIETFHAIKNKE